MFTIQWVRGLAIVGTLAIALTGCTSETTTSATDTVDIRNAILTNTSGDCADYSAAYQAEVTDIERDMGFISQFDVSEDGESCAVTANVIPNYDFNDGTGRFAEPVAEPGTELVVEPISQPSLESISDINSEYVNEHNSSSTTSQMGKRTGNPICTNYC